jgi:hypothetical protein
LVIAAGGVEEKGRECLGFAGVVDVGVEALLLLVEWC